MIRVGLLILAVGATYQAIPICRPLKDDESYRLKSNSTIKVGEKRIVNDELVEHKCLEIDEHGTEHIEVTTLEGTIKRGDAEAESTKGETYNYFQNSFGQRFQYEEIRVNLKDDPIGYISEEMHAKLKDRTVVADETWRDKSANTTYTITVGQIKQFMKTDCIEVVRKGTFTNGITGEFKEDTWYRVSDGQLMAQTTTADNVVITDVPEIQYFEKLEFRPEKS